MKIGLIQFPGSNCERETALAIQRSGMIPVDCYWHHSPEAIKALDGYVIVGGFSYEDRLRSGVLASLDPIIKTLITQTELGKPLLGVCNGAQILIESGLVPGLRNYPLAGALSNNLPLIGGERKRVNYYNDWCYLKASNSNHAFTNQIRPDQLLHVPFAHAEGRFIVPEGLLNEIVASDASFFQYVNEQGRLLEEAPINPNGSIANFAAMSNLAGNVMAMMPHPERCVQGNVIFDSMHAYLKKNTFKQARYRYVPINPVPKSFLLQAGCHELIIEQFIEDNTAKSLALALSNQGFDVQVKRYTYWSIDANMDPEVLREKIHQCAELYNPSKAAPIHLTPPTNTTLRYLICDKENNIGKQKINVLKQHFNMTFLNNINHAELVCLNTPPHQLEDLKAFLHQSHLLFNPYGEIGYAYNG